MSFAAGSVRSRALPAVMYAGVALLFLASLSMPYVDTDALLYALVGHGAVREGVAPYGYVFDHKPALLYYLYGPLAFLGRNMFEFQIFSLAWLLALALIAWRLFLERQVAFACVLLLLAFLAQATVQFSGNSEWVFVPFQLLAVRLAVGADMRPRRLALSAACAAVAVNVNYASVFILAAPLLYGLWRSAPDRRTLAAHLAAYAASVAAVTLTLFAALLALGGDLGAYWRLQSAFLAAYSAADMRPDVHYLLKTAGILILATAALAFRLRAAPPTRDQRTLDGALYLLVLAASAFPILSGKPWWHLLFVPAAPAAILLARAAASDARVGSALTWMCLFLSGLAIHGLVADGPSRRYDRADFAAPYRRIAAAVGSAPVMSMQASVVPLYYSGARPFQPIVWPDQTRILFGAREDDYHRSWIARAPPFVLTAPGWCAGEGRDWTSCAMLRRDYRVALRFDGDGAGQVGDRLAAGYELYQRRER